MDNSTNIQDSVNKVSEDDTINLQPGTYKESNITVVEKDITLHGNGKADNIIIDGEKKNGIIIASSSKLTIKNITFMNAFKEDNGGAISLVNGGQLIIENCRFINNKVIYTAGQALGGAVYSEGDSKNYIPTYITNCTFIGNSALTDGGAINTKFGNVTIKDCTFIDNFATRDGGAVSTRGLSIMNIENSNFINNSADEWGGAINNWLAEYTIINSNFISNNAGTRGGAISTCGLITNITFSRFINNTAVEGGAINIHLDSEQYPPEGNFNYNEFIGNTAKSASLIYIYENAVDNFDFENNYWGEITPNSTEWSEEFVANGVCENPTIWLEKTNNTITGENITRGYNSEYDFTAEFVNNHNIPLYEKEVFFIIDGKNYSAVTDSNGIAKLAVKLPVGEYLVSTVNPISNDKNINKLSIVKRISGNKNLIKDYLDSKTFKVLIIGDDGKAVGSGVKVNVVLNGVKSILKTDKNGYITKKITLTAGKYTVKVTYKDYSVSNKITVNQILKSKNVSVKSKKNIKVQATLKYSNSKALKNKKIKFSFKGKTYTAKTNSKGIAKVTIKNKYKAGKYALKISYEKQSIKKTVTIN